MDPTIEPVGEEVNREDLGRDAHHEQLLPGLPDDFTLGEIAPKLPWRSLCWLASESPNWLRVMQNREVYDARVVYGALESLVVLKYCNPWVYNRLGLYSTRHGFLFELPHMPTCEEDDCEFVTLDGKIYGLGWNNCNFCYVYALDLAGPKRQWKQCAPMLQQKKYFPCATLDGKIYARGIYELRKPCDIEVYDPKENKWTLIEPRPHRPYWHSEWHGATGEELVLVSCEEAHLSLEYFVDLYHPAKAEWRGMRLLPMIDRRVVVGPHTCLMRGWASGQRHKILNDRRVVRLWPVIDKWLGNLFTVHGNLHRMKDGCISVLDMDTGRWRFKHHYPCEEHDQNFRVLNITCVGDELLLLVARIDGRMSIIQSEGFGDKNIDITWKNFIHPGCPGHIDFPSHYLDFPYEIYPIDL